LAEFLNLSIQSTIKCNECFSKLCLPFSLLMSEKQ
jgi:hypothetical protein